MTEATNKTPASTRSARVAERWFRCYALGDREQCQLLHLLYLLLTLVGVNVALLLVIATFLVIGLTRK